MSSASVRSTTLPPNLKRRNGSCAAILTARATCAFLALVVVHDGVDKTLPIGVQYFLFLPKTNS